MAFTDSSSALGWMHHSTFNPEQHPVHDEVARCLARDLIENNTSLHSQHIKGKNNEVADSLSRDFHFSNKQLTKFLHSKFSKKMPSNFEIFEVPDEISSWLSSLRAKSTSEHPSPQTRVPSKEAAGRDGKDFFDGEESETPSCLSSVQLNAARSLLRLHSQLGITALAEQLSLDSWLTRSKPPCVMYQRHSARTFGGTRPRTQKEMSSSH